jgi:hypothetical protein
MTETVKRNYKKTALHQGQCGQETCVKRALFGVDHILPEQEGYERQFLLKPLNHILKECQIKIKLVPLQYDPPPY